MNAVDFIRKSVFYTSSKYAQIRPLVEKVLTDRSIENDLTALVDAVAPLGNSVHPGLPIESQPAPSIAVPTVRVSDPDTPKVKAIRRIGETRNVALIKQMPAIPLTEGLNIFYGHNGDGKTTLYRAISNCFGLADHSLDNVGASAAQPPQVQLTVEDAQGRPLDLVWPSTDPVRLEPIKRFDAELCLALVQDDQDTTFSLVHLKQEYFALLGDALRGLSIKIDERNRLISEDLQRSTVTIQRVVPNLYDVLSSLTRVQLANASISEEERKALAELEESLHSIEKDELAAKIRTLASDISHIDEILRSLGKPILDPAGAVSNWELACTESFFERAGNLLDAFRRDSVLLDVQASALSRFVPEAWLSRRDWRAFVTAALAFIRSLESSEQKTYREQKCPYCQQSLTQDARHLLAAYEDVLAEVKTRLDNTETQRGITESCGWTDDESGVSLWC